MIPLKLIRDCDSFEYNLCDSICFNYKGVLSVWAKFYRLSGNMIVQYNIEQCLENKVEND